MSYLFSRKITIQLQKMYMCVINFYEKILLKWRWMKEMLDKLFNLISQITHLSEGIQHNSFIAVSICTKVVV